VGSTVVPGATSKISPYQGAGLLLGFALLKLLLHLLAGEGYGYFRDEFYYIACSDHLAWGYVDHPPFSVALLRLSRFVLGDSVIAIRLLPALAGAATVYLVGHITRRLGGGTFAQALAMASTLVAPAFVAAGGYFSMNGFDLLFWTLAAALLIRILDDGPASLWPLLGVVLGLGLQNKISVLWLGFGLAAGLLLTKQRRLLLTAGPWIAASIALAIFSPYLIWQWANDWPTLEFIRNATGSKMQEGAPLEFFGGQLLSMHPFTLPVWLGGLVFLLLHPDGRRWRVLGWIWVAVAGLLILNGTSRSGYLAPAYAAVFAAGGVMIERGLRRVPWAWPRAAIIAVLVAGGVALAPFAIPLLPVETYIRYAAALGIGPSTSERKELVELPQHFADMFGWGELIAELDRVYGGLSAAERERAGIFVYNYGEAGAIDLLGRARNLPRALSGHNNYWFWQPERDEIDVLIVVGGSERGHLRLYDDVQVAGRTSCSYCMPYENDQTIYILRNPRVSWSDAWPSLKHFD